MFSRARNKRKIFLETEMEAASRSYAMLNHRGNLCGVIWARLRQNCTVLIGTIHSNLTKETITFASMNYVSLLRHSQHCQRYEHVSWKMSRKKHDLTEHKPLHDSTSTIIYGGLAMRTLTPSIIFYRVVIMFFITYGQNFQPGGNKTIGMQLCNFGPTSRHHLTFSN